MDSFERGFAMTEKKKQKQAKKSTKNQKSSIKSTLINSLSESIENLKSVQHLSTLFDQMHHRIADVKQEANKEFSKLVTLYEKNYKDLEKKISKATKDAKKQAQVKMIALIEKWHENKDKLPKPISKEVDGILVKIAEKTMDSKKAKPEKKTSTPKKAHAKAK